MNPCPHDLAERETMVVDGFCPECMRAEYQAREARLREALEEAWAEVHAEHGDLNSPKWVSLQECAELACVRALAALAEPKG